MAIVKKVLVTGAGGRTGGLVVKRLLQRPQLFEPIATVRSEQSKAALASKLGLKESNIRVVDIAQPQDALRGQLTTALQGCNALVIATSAVPEIVPAPPGAPPGPPNFKWKEDQKPEQVDWLGQQAQVDAAKAAGVQRVVIVSSMGGTDPNNNLNRIGGNGNILQWKRKAEQYLIASGLTYTIIHPGGLLDQPGGERQLTVGVDDKLVTGTNRSVPREDVAEVCVQSLLVPEYSNRSFDLASLPPGEGTVTSDFAALIATLDGRNCDYSINSQI